MKYLVIMAIGALASALSNRGVAVFNDGFRPLVPQFFENKITRKELAAMSFAISFGLVIGFAIPTSIAASIILIHCLLLTTDMIGTFCSYSLKGTILAAVIGAAYGLGILLGLEAIIKAFEVLPYNFLGSLGQVSMPIVAGFAIFPAVAIGLQHGFKKALISAAVTILVWFLIKKVGIISMGDYKITLSAEGLAMFSGMIMMLIFASTVKSAGGSSNTQLTSVFSAQVARIQKNWYLLALLGGLVAAGTSLTILAGDPISLNLLSKGEITSAAMAAFARAIGFVPLVLTTAVVTGVYGAVGCTFVFVVGILLTGQPLFAFLAGAAILTAEVFLINFFAKIMDKFTGIREMGEHIRTAMNKVLEVALLLGSTFAANAMIAGIGPMFIIACYLLNKQSKKPIVDIAVGPVAAILFGIVVNILVIIGLYVVPAAK
ncbi:MAG: YhfT family protein [Elusimicrobiota bacterium]|jgi:hypothetical protein|nr:YhfT family protein [Elusimicrobiota bacterium]